LTNAARKFRYRCRCVGLIILRITC